MSFRHGFPRVGSHKKPDNLNAFHGSRRWYAPAAVPRNPQGPDSPEPTPAFATVSSVVASSLPTQTNTTISPSSSSSTMDPSNTPSPYSPVPFNDPPIHPSNSPGRRPDSPGGGSGIPGISILSGDSIFGGSSKSSDGSGGGPTIAISGGASSGLNVPSQSTSPDVAASQYASTVAAPGSSSSPGVNVSGETKVTTKESGSKKGVAAIAVGVTSGFVAFLGFVVVFLHYYRRSRKRRSQNRNHWFFSRKRTSSLGEKRPTSGARSSWSSFETPHENSSLRSSTLMPDGTSIDDQKQVVGPPTDGGTWAQAIRVDPRSNVQR